MWVITRAENEYSQYGEYFEAVFKEKPTLEELAQCFYEESLEQVASDGGKKIIFLVHLLNGGGRRNNEDTWFFLKEVEEGTWFEHEHGQCC